MLEKYTDSQGQTHDIYMQEKITSCSMATICTLMHLIDPTLQVEESHIRAMSQRHSYHYRPHPADVNANQLTFIAKLMVLAYIKPEIGTRPINIGLVLQSYGIYSDKASHNELQNINNSNLHEILKDKIAILSVKMVGSGTSHSILLREIHNDGTFVIYDSSKGLVETKDFLSIYTPSSGANFMSQCPFIIGQSQLKTIKIDLEAGPAEKRDDQVVAGATVTIASPSMSNKT